MQPAPEEESGITPKSIFFLLLKVFLGLIGILVASLFIFMIIRAEEYKGFFYILFIIIASLIVFRLYLQNIQSPSRLKPEPEQELYGSLESMAAMISRASKGYEYSQEKLEETLSRLRGKECHLHGNGTQYLESLKEILEEL